jgi:hypothetical protein
MRERPGIDLYVKIAIGRFWIISDDQGGKTCVGFIPESRPLARRSIGNRKPAEIGSDCHEILTC